MLAVLSYMTTYGQCNQGTCQNIPINNAQPWSNSHGTPSWGATSVWLWSYFQNNTISGEGVNYSGFNFVQGTDYCVSFTLNATTNTGQIPNAGSSMNVILTPNAVMGIVGSNTNNPVPPTPNPNQTLMSQNIWANGNNQQVYTFNFTANQNFNNIWFFPSNPAAPNPQIEVAISNMTICTIDDCDTTDSPVFDIDISCNNGNKCVTVTSNDPDIPNHWWGLMEIIDYSDPNNTSDANTANNGAPVTLITGQSSATFCWLDLSKRYYIKHGIWDPGCYTWREVRTPVPNFDAEAVFHLEDENDNVKDEFCYGEDIILDGTASQGENRYFIDAWRRPIGSPQNFGWYGGLGWTLNSTVGEVNLSQEFANLSNPKYFEPGYEYEIKLAIANLENCIGWTEVRHTFTVVCCDDFLDASFHSSQSTTGNIDILSFDLYDTINATHEWYIVSSPNQTGGPYTPVLNTTSTGPAPFTLTFNAQSGLFYTVIHKVTTLCGEVCSANVHYYLRGENISKDALYSIDIKNGCELIDEVFTECLAPTNLRYDCRSAGLSWSGDPNATYIVEVNWDDYVNCRSCKGTRPAGNQWEVQGTSFSLPFIHESNCFSWRVGTKCKDGTIKWSSYGCSDCLSRPQEPGVSDVKTSAKISPNPNDGHMNIEIFGNDKTAFTLNVYRFDGVLIKTFNENRIENESITISWNGKSVLARGMYFFVITTDKETITKKVIIE